MCIVGNKETLVWHDGSEVKSAPVEIVEVTQIPTRDDEQSDMIQIRVRYDDGDEQVIEVPADGEVGRVL